MVHVSFAELFGDDPHSFHHQTQRMKPIIILGFGRSGTTWLSDIFSRIYGGLVLFEPLHPSVTDRAIEFAYRREIAGEDSEWLNQHLRSVLDKEVRKPWLLRNHLPNRIETISSEAMDYIWDECRVIGFKEIRMNLMIPWLAERQVGQIIFIVRNKSDVISSIRARSNFWEFGWPSTYELAMQYLPDSVRSRTGIEEWIDRTLEVSLADCARYDVPVVSYEELRGDPFKAMRSLIARCHLPQRSIHPSHVYQPSRTTLRSFDGIWGK